MAKSFECSHAGVVCGSKVTGDTDEEVVSKAVAHAKQAHGVDLTQAQTLVRYAQSLVHDDASTGEKG